MTAVAKGLHEQTVFLIRCASLHIGSLSIFLALGWREDTLWAHPMGGCSYFLRWRDLGAFSKGRAFLLRLRRPTFVLLVRFPFLIVKRHALRALIVREGKARDILVALKERIHIVGHSRIASSIRRVIAISRTLGRLPLVFLIGGVCDLNGAATQTQTRSLAVSGPSSRRRHKVVILIRGLQHAHPGDVPAWRPRRPGLPSYLCLSILCPGRAGVAGERHSFELRPCEKVGGLPCVGLVPRHLLVPSPAREGLGQKSALRARGAICSQSSARLRSHPPSQPERERMSA